MLFSSPRNLGWLLFLPLVFTACGPDHAPELLHARVTDHAGLLTPVQQRDLELTFATFEDTTTNQFLLLTIPTLGGREIKSYMKEVTDFNGFGTALRKNGLLLLVIRDSNEVAIEAGNGIAPSLDSSRALTRVEKQLREGLKRGEAYAAIRTAFDSLIAATPKRFVPDPVYRSNARQN